MSAVKVSEAVVGKCYKDESGSYLGKYLRIDKGQERERGLGFVPIYVFENGIINDSWPTPKVTPIDCKNGGKRKGTRKRRSNKRGNKSRRV